MSDARSFMEQVAGEGEPAGMARPTVREGDRWRAVWYEDGQRRLCERFAALVIASVATVPAAGRPPRGW
jgi:hypothetical protein